MLCPFCKHSILGFFFDLHDGELPSVDVRLQLPSDIVASLEKLTHTCANDDQIL